MKTPKEIKEFLNNKVLANINFTAKEIISGNTPNVETISIDDFLEWFENKPKEENQDIITFDGKEYEFIEYTWGECCINCDLRVLDFCTLSPRICCSDKRRDRKEGYFKLIKQKNLELIPNEFYYLKKDNFSWVIQFKEFRGKAFDPIFYYYMLKIHDNGLSSDYNCANNGWVKATPAQKQQLIDKVQEVTDKVWNEETKMFEDKPKEILVPENINIYTDNSLDPLGISFNNDRQILAFREEFSIYEVFPNTILWKKIDCKLVPTLFSDLKVGDIFTNSFAVFDNLLTELDSYLIKLSEENICFIQDSNCVITSFYDLEDCAIQKVDYYKVVPLN